MEYFPWWNEAQKKLADDAKKLTDEVLIPLCEKSAWKKEFPWEAIKEIGKAGWMGAQIPAKYGGKAEEWGVTGANIILEELGRAGEVAAPVSATMIGGVHQILHDGTKEQKEQWLPRIAKGEALGSITMTEPYAGTDIASIETTGVKDGDYYIVNGKKRFQTGAAAASVYMAYVKTSKKPEDRAKFRHLTALVIDKGTPGFSVEKVNDLMALDGIYNCYLNFNNVKVPVSNRLGEEGAGWAVMMSGLNVERICSASPSLGVMRETIRYTQQHLQRRVQFAKRTGDMPTNQFKLAEMIAKYKVARLITYYAAYCADLGLEVPVESAICKLFNPNWQQQMADEAIQCMGGNGATRYYPVERYYRDAKLFQIAAGTDEALKLVLYRMGVRTMTDDLKAPYRVIDEELEVPMPVGKPLPKKAAGSEDDVLAVLAEDYRVNPGLHMTLDDLNERLDVSADDLNKYLSSLEEKGLASLHRGKKETDLLARATYEGLAKANPAEFYKYIPSWANEADMF